MTAYFPAYPVGSRWLWKRSDASYGNIPFTIIGEVYWTRRGQKVRVEYETDEDVWWKKGPICTDNLTHRAKLLNPVPGDIYLLWNIREKKYAIQDDQQYLYIGKNKCRVDVFRYWRTLAPALNVLAEIDHPFSWEIHRGSVNRNMGFLYAETVKIPHWWKRAVLNLRKKRLCLGSKLPMTNVVSVMIDRSRTHSWKYPEYARGRGICHPTAPTLQFFATKARAIAAKLGATDRHEIIDLR